MWSSQFANVHILQNRVVWGFMLNGVSTCSWPAEKFFSVYLSWCGENYVNERLRAKPQHSLCYGFEPCCLFNRSRTNMKWTRTGICLKFEVVKLIYGPLSFFSSRYAQFKSQHVKIGFDVTVNLLLMFLFISCKWATVARLSNMQGGHSLAI